MFYPTLSAMTLLQGCIIVNAASTRKRHCVSAGALLFAEISGSLYISDRRCAVNEDTLVGFSRSNQRDVVDLMMMMKIATGFWQDRAHCRLAIISCWCHDINWKSSSFSIAALVQMVDCKTCWWKHHYRLYLFFFFQTLVIRNTFKLMTVVIIKL